MARVLLVGLALLGLSACGEQSRPALAGDPAHGQLLLRQFACGACHRIPGVAAAKGNVGPPLEGIGARVYIAGFLPNTPQNMAAWIRHPQKLDPKSAMPDLAVSEAHARDMVAYLQSLK